MRSSIASTRSAPALNLAEPRIATRRPCQRPCAPFYTGFMTQHHQNQGGESLYSLYRRGMELLEDGAFEEAAVPLQEAARQAPEKSSVREALGRALFRTRRYAEAATEFEAVVETHPVNDYAHFCLGRALSKTGDTRRARHHLALASNLRPERRDYRIYRERLAASV
jgi:tetratricopeptide (TPR) repeat protein